MFSSSRSRCRRSSAPAGDVLLGRREIGCQREMCASGGLSARGCGLACDSGVQRTLDRDGGHYAPRTR